MPAGYVISEVEIKNLDAVNAYKPLAKAAVIEFGGTYLVRDAVPDALEGSFPPSQRIVVVKFDSVETARDWYHSAAYNKALTAANGALDRRLFLVSGHDG